MITILVKSPHQAYRLSDIPVGGAAVSGIAFEVYGTDFNDPKQ
jgi:hypothetical protein